MMLSTPPSVRETRRTATVHLPWPPSVNNLYFNAGRKRVRAPLYRKWQEEAGWMVKAAKVPAFAQPVAITLDLCPPDNRRTDADNRTKPVLDLLVACGVLPDDSRKHVQSVTARFVENSVHSCVVTIEEVGE